MADEFDYISWIRKQQKPTDLVRLGIGDDLAVLNWAAKDLLLVGVDQVLDGVHFDSKVHSPEAIGRKAMNRNLSDCAAMGCLPAAAVVTVALPKGVGEEYAKELYLGMKKSGEVFDCPIVGGDTSSWHGKLVVTVTILGRSAGIDPITRSGAKVGDSIYVTGPLGGSIRGRHMTFLPRVAIARELTSKYSITAMIDLSDGLSRDLAHLCRQSALGALLDDRMIPIHGDALELVMQEGIEPLDQYMRALSHAVHDGEDYELLFTSNDKIDGFVRIGVMTKEPDIRFSTAKSSLKPAAWEHQF